MTSPSAWNASESSLRNVARAQAPFFALSGVWPLVSLRSFEAVTGPKVDGWLVQTVGALIAVVGGALGMGVRRRSITPELAFVGAASALALGTVDVVFVKRGRIPPIYLADAAVEFLLAGWWARAALRARKAGWESRHVALSTLDRAG